MIVRPISRLPREYLIAAALEPIWTANLGFSKARKEQGLTCVKMNATEDVNWLDMPAVLDATVERLKAVKALGLNAGLDFHGRLHRPMAKQLAKALEPHRPLFIEEPILVEHPEALKQLANMTSIPIALGERLYHRWDAKKFLEDIDILQPDIAHAGTFVAPPI